MHLDFDHCYRALRSRDARFDGSFFAGVTSTGIYCRPSCPARSVKRENVRFFPTAAAAQAAGFRACKRCRPDASPGSPEWDVRADLVGRAMRLIADGVVDREGVDGLARCLHVSARHLQRQLVAEVGAAPQATLLASNEPKLPAFLSRRPRFLSQRWHSEPAFQAFVSSTTPSERSSPRPPPRLRTKNVNRGSVTPGTLSIRLPYRAPFDGKGLLAFLGARGISGVESFDGAVYRRALRLPTSDATVELAVGDDHVRCALRLGDIRDLGPAVRRCRQLLDLDADPVAIDQSLRNDRLLGPVVRAPSWETAARKRRWIRACRTRRTGSAGLGCGGPHDCGSTRSYFGKPLTSPDGDLTHVFPDPAALARRRSRSAAESRGVVRRR